MADVRRLHDPQGSTHERLEEVVRRHLETVSQRPYGRHAEAAFDEVVGWLGQTPGKWILDSGCGVGESTARIAAAFPDAKVVGVDKSAPRLGKHGRGYAGEVKNYRLVRADVRDLWRQLAAASIIPAAHYLLYPNPYPKAAQLRHRWHGSDGWPALLALGGEFELRSNWRVYVDECAAALAVSNHAAVIDAVPASGEALTPFERKYLADGQACWRLKADLSRP